MTATDRAIDLLGPLALPPATYLLRAMLAATETPWALGVDPGIAAYLAPDAAPTEWFPWLARVAGARYSLAYSEAQQRAELDNPAGWRRGSLGGMHDTVARTLTGTQFVFIAERDPDAYGLVVATLTSETTDPDVTHAAAVSQKPAGLLLVYKTIDQQLWAQVADRYDTWADVAAAYDSWADVAADS